MKKILGIIGTWAFGNAAWISAVVNFVWMLVKDNQLFSWWWPVGLFLASLVCLGVTFWGIIDN